MKHTKKALALLMALVMSLSLLTATAFADTSTGEITIENATSGKTYTLYKVFDATYSTDAAAAYTIKTGDAWYNLVKDAGSPFQLSTKTVGDTDDTYTVTLKSGKTEDDVRAWFKTVTPPATATKSETPAANGALTFDELDNGYYYVTSTLGGVVTLTNLNNSVTIVDKNQKPGWGENGGKFVKSDDDNDYVTTNTAEIGETLSYKVVVNAAPNYTENGKVVEYVIDDVEGSAIYANFHSIEVKVNGTKIEGGFIKGYDSCGISNTMANSWHAVSGEDRTLVDETTTGMPAGCNWYVVNAVEDDNTFSIHINWVDANKELLYKEVVNTIEVTYDAVLQEDASVGANTTNNVNRAALKWTTVNGNIENDTTKTVTTTTFGLGVEKKDATSNAVLKGVQFTVTKSGENSPIKVYPSVSKTDRYYIANEYTAKLTDANMTGKTTTLTTNEHGRFVVVGLKAGAYVLTETKPLDGYNSIADTEVTLGAPADESGWTDFNSISTIKVDVKNSKGTLLPETGGIGTTLFVTLGALAVVGTGLFLVTNKRISKEDI